ncbi:phenazine biosynthesis protein family, partial [Nannochloropsis gaditana CCMP526]
SYLTLTIPPRLDAWYPTKSLFPSSPAQYGARQQCADPV